MRKNDTPPRLITVFFLAGLAWVGAPGCGGGTSPEPDVIGQDVVLDTVSDIVAPDAQLDAECPDIESDSAIIDTMSDAADSQATTARVTLTVVIPPETPADATVLVNSPAWDEARAADCGAATTVCTLMADVPVPTTTSWNAELRDGALAHVPLRPAGTVAAGEALIIATASDGQTATLTVERWGAPSGETPFAAAFLVTPPASTPPFETLHIAGGAPSLGDWDGRGLPLRPARNGLHAAWLTIADRRSVAFKVTRGSWYTVEKGFSGEEIPNRQLDLGGGIARAFVSPATWADLIGATWGTLTGDIRIFRDVPSTHLAAIRDVVVWLPPAYHVDPTRHFPVMVLHDGHNTMNAETSFVGVEWGVDETLRARIEAGDMPPVIAVAVSGTNDRIDEYTPSVDPQYGGGKAMEYGRFLVEELLPLIAEHVRTESGPDATALLGSSLGGLVSMWLGLEYPNVFGRLGVMSPSVWWDDRMIVDAVTAFDGAPSARIWLDIGTAEGSGTTAVDNARALRDALTSKGWVEERNLAYRVYAGAGHNEAAWAARFGDMAVWLFAD